ncbi:MAG TPA: HAMP domain-containing histidine kinase [Candidatus Blautia faecigallinarum]|uniref:histidine kinase n=1 Tax=Candidatus Blautia faecigallinarum TaxID=2838488 RepID=A0A9D2ISE3_9FIRM|nr:HAMP domain-containing histidine kinase [Candidatus Blautia faecigallinarum]
MKKVPLKWKLTILYAAFMILMTGIMLSILFSLSSSEILSSVETDLENDVFGAFEDIQWDGKRLKIDRDFYEVEKGIYLSAYNSGESLIGGRIPYEFTLNVPLGEGLRRLTQEGISWYIWDTSSNIEGYGKVYVRGITSITEAESSLRVTLRLSVILFPLLVVLAASLGYFFVSRTLRPVSRITSTARAIYEEEDLSKRIGLTGEKNELYKLAETFDLMLEKVEKSFEKEKQFTSDASHELRTPVAVILSQCEYLLEDTQLSQETRSAVEVIQRKAGNMAKIISQLLFLSRADQNRQVIHKEYLELSLLTEMAAEEQQEIAKTKGIRIETDIQEGVQGYVDETLFIRIWMNLIGNGISYGKENGWLKISMKEKEGILFGSVEDNGIGITKEQLPHIWERFYQADASRSQRDGAGLGLPMVKWIVQIHGGEIKAESEYGQGSRFAFTIPIRETPSQNREKGRI